MDSRPFFSLLIFVSCVLAGEAVLEVLSTYTELSSLNSILSQSTTLSKLLSEASNFTFLAPTNDALESWVGGSTTALSGAEIEAVLTYHLLEGSYTVLDFTDEPQFVETQLTNTSYANVTGGQRVELLSSSSGSPVFVSGNQSISTIATQDIVVGAGLIQIINKVLTVPPALVALLAQDGLNFFIEIISKGGFLSSDASVLESKILNAPDVTYFCPNSQAALDAFTTLSANMTQAEKDQLFEYHIVEGFVGYTSQLEDGMQLRTTAGTNVTVTIQDGETFINGAKITTPDLIVGNGVAHVLDNLLNPLNTTGPPAPTSTATTAKSAAAQKAGIGIGVVFVIGAVTGGAFFLFRYLRQRVISSSTQNEGNPRSHYNGTPNLQSRMEAAELPHGMHGTKGSRRFGMQDFELMDNNTPKSSHKISSSVATNMTDVTLVGDLIELDASTGLHNYSNLNYATTGVHHSELDATSSPHSETSELHSKLG